MAMNVFFYEMKAYRKSTLTWTLSLIAVTVCFLSLFPSVSKDIDQFNKLLEGFPEPVRKAFGIQIGSLGTVLGYYSYSFLYILLCGAIQGMNLGLSILSKEVRDKTADFLFTKPISRTRVLTSKLAAAVGSLIATNAAYIAAAGIMAAQVSKDPFSTVQFLLIAMTLFFVQLIFLSLGFVISVLYSKIKSVLTISLGTVFCSFFIGMLAATGGDEAKRYLSPFKYFDTAYIMEHSAYEVSFMLTGLGIVLVAIAVSYFVYTRKDIHSV
jgi:ABC-2 type transport system permease protein